MAPRGACKVLPDRRGRRHGAQPVWVLGSRRGLDQGLATAVSMDWEVEAAAIVVDQNAALAHEAIRRHWKRGRQSCVARLPGTAPGGRKVFSEMAVAIYRLNIKCLSSVRVTCRVGAWIGGIMTMRTGLRNDGMHGEYKVPGGKLIVVDYVIVEGRLANMQVSGDFFLEPPSALDMIDQALGPKRCQGQFPRPISTPTIGRRPRQRCLRHTCRA